MYHFYSNSIHLHMWHSVICSSLHSSQQNTRGDSWQRNLLLPLLLLKLCFPFITARPTHHNTPYTTNLLRRAVSFCTFAIHTCVLLASIVLLQFLLNGTELLLNWGFILSLVLTEIHRWVLVICQLLSKLRTITDLTVFLLSWNSCTVIPVDFHGKKKCLYLASLCSNNGECG